MPHEIEFTVSARKELAKLQKIIQPKQLRRIKETIDRLKVDARPLASEVIVNTDYLRIRTGDYRIVYQVEDEVLTVLVIRIGHRKEVYRRRS